MMKNSALQGDVLTDLIERGCQSFTSTSELQERIASIFHCAKVFFRESELSSKIPYQTEIGEGYRPFAFEYTDSPDQPDLMEWFACSLSRSSVKLRFPEGSGLVLYEALLAAHHLFAEYAEITLHTLLSQLGIAAPPSEYRFGFLEWSRFQINYSVTRRVPRDLLVVPHEDGNFLTIATSTAPGLELVGADGSVQDIWWPSEDRVTVIAGGILSLITRGQVRTGFHQVRRRVDTPERLGLVYFADPDPTTLAEAGVAVSARAIHDLMIEGWLRSGVPPVQVRIDLS